MYLVKPHDMTPVSQAELIERQQRFRLAGILRLTELMLDAAEKGDWNTVDNLEHERWTELSDFSIAPEVFDTSDNIAEAYASLLVLNEKIMTLAEAAKESLRQEYKQNRKQNNVAKIYSDI